MLRRLIYTIMAMTLLSVVLISCENDNKGYKEYYNSMGNNPVMVVPWLNKIAKSYRKTHAIIKQYQYQGRKYYVTQAYYYTTPQTSPVTIYEGDDNKAIVYWETENVLDPNTLDSVFICFKDSAKLDYVLWKNEPKSGGFLDL